MLNGLSLFSGVGGIDVALSEYVRPIAYCEIDPYCQGVLLSNMSRLSLRAAPIWNDVTTFDGRGFRGCIDIIYGGSPCQGFSVAGHGKGLEDKRSGLFYEVIRLAREIDPPFIFLENTKGILSNGGVEVINALTKIGYSCRWITKSCKEVGSPQNRERWFCLAYSKHFRSSSTKTMESIEKTVRDSKKGKNKTSKSERSDSQGMLSSDSTIRSQNYWSSEPPICRVVTRIPFAMERIKCMGNSVCPQQTKEAFEELMGLK